MISETVSPQYQVCRDLYRYLLERAEPESVMGQDLPVFRGSLTKAYESTNGSGKYYSLVWDYLKNYGCLTVLQKGSRGVESVVVLHHEPDENTFEQMRSAGLTPAGADARMEARLTAVERNIGGMDIVEAFSNFERRLQALEGRGGKKS